MFVGPLDSYMLRDAGEGAGWAQAHQAVEAWHRVGTQEEREPLVMERYLTYDEGKIAALLGASTHTVTANKGTHVVAPAYTLDPDSTHDHHSAPDPDSAPEHHSAPDLAILMYGR